MTELAELARQTGGARLIPSHIAGFDAHPHAATIASMPDDEDPITRPDARRSSQEFQFDADRERARHEMNLAKINGTNTVPAAYLEAVLDGADAERASLHLLIGMLTRLLPPCGKCASPGTKRLVAAMWCDDHAPPDAADIPGASFIRKALRIAAL